MNSHELGWLSLHKQDGGHGILWVILGKVNYDRFSVNLNQWKSIDSQWMSTNFQSEPNHWFESVIRFWLRISRFQYISTDSSLDF